MNRKTIFVGLILLAACEEFQPKAPQEYELLDGPVSGLTETENLQFLKGDVAFNDEVFIPATGLGPLFVANSCGSCHPGDGKGHPFTTLTRFGQTDETGNQYLNAGGPQLQHRAIPGYKAEQIPVSTTYSSFTPPAVTGLGFLDAVSDEDILAWADPDDDNGDGISGVPNWIEAKDYVTLRPNSITQNGKYIGRFGKKGAVYDLLQQTATAYNEDIGITSTYEAIDTYLGVEYDPEVSNQTIQDVVFYLKTLKAPVPRKENAEILFGKEIFSTIGCATCHRPEMKTGASPIAALSNKTFYPYTDLLLHDMGPSLDDGYTEGSAKTYEWRTPPLWGLGLSKNSQGGQYFLMHDGRARSIEQAIQMHSGEGMQSGESFESLTGEDKRKLIKFLESL
ncbi:MAG TPA: di-heme oxidoredictase family protein [Cyclobacteriaceae bacterium]|nr:di-heme oxidoredictase family protein [Cyclobacteriaceae bacterium]HRJ80981.1 di-heme oxidoredictase family protein [Cyclobacteriaceae bacterium]